MAVLSCIFEMYLFLIATILKTQHNCVIMSKCVCPVNNILGARKCLGLECEMHAHLILEKIRETGYSVERQAFFTAKRIFWTSLVAQWMRACLPM